MKRVKLVVAYDGTNYCGWQIQKNGITIEEVLNKALSDLLREPVAVIGASRTDSGVHAEGNVAVFDTENRMPADKICFALNQKLPADIRVLSSGEIPGDWHPRKQNCIKTYEYKILNRKIDIPTLRLYTHFCYVPLCLEKMRAAASYLVGEHDFQSFCSSRGQAEETVRTIYSLELEQAGDVITIRISGSGFLYNMVRIIAGTLMKTGMGVYPPEHVKEILEARERQMAGPKAAAKGLTLVSLEYEDELRPEITGENKDWKYCLIQQEVVPKGKAYLVIERCVDADFERLLTRVTHQAVRNGAHQVFVYDKEREGRLQPGRAYGYYTFAPAHVMWKLRCPVGTISAEGCKENMPELEALTVEATESGIAEYCQLYNELFFSVPNSATLTEKELREHLECERDFVFWVKKAGRVAGFLLLIEKEGGELEIDGIGILSEFRKQGIARAVFSKVDGLARERGFDTLTLLVSDANENAFRLYRELGFQTEKQISQWFETKNLSFIGKRG